MKTRSGVSKEGEGKWWWRAGWGVEFDTRGTVAKLPRAAMSSPVVSPSPASMNSDSRASLGNG